MKKLLSVLTFSLFVQFAFAQETQRKMTFEVLWGRSIDFGYFDKQYQSSSSPYCYYFPNYGKGDTYLVKRNRDQGYFGRNISLQENHGLLVNYTINKKSYITTGFIRSNIGVLGMVSSPRVEQQIDRIAKGLPYDTSVFKNGTLGYSFARAEYLGVIKIPVLLNYRFINWPELNFAADIGVGGNIDIMKRNGTQDTEHILAYGVDTMEIYFHSSIVNHVGFSATGILRTHIGVGKKGNSINLNFTYNKGFVPMVAENFNYSINGQPYFSRILTNGTQMVATLSYSFGAPKPIRRLLDGSKSKKTGKNEYLFK